MGRVKQWATILTASIVSLVSLIAAFDDRKISDWEKYQKWTVSVASISVGISFLGALVSMLPAGQALKLESPLITIVLGIWAAGLPSILDPDNYLAVNPAYGIENANLYFFSWTALITSVSLAGNWGKEVLGDQGSKTATQWALLGAASFVVMGTTSALYKDYQCGDIESIGDSPKCKRTQFAVYLGLSSGVLAIAMFALNQAPFHCQGIVSFLLTAAWCCGVSYITFGEGPGTSMGNVYFATWACLFLGLNLTTTAVKHAMGAKDDDKDDGSVKKEKKSAAEEEEKSDEEDDGAEP